MKARIAGFSPQTLIQGAFLFKKRLLLPLRGYIFDSNDQGFP
jgi:hypothetical protein